jgi:hypothetical protein
MSLFLHSHLYNLQILTVFFTNCSYLWPQIHVATMTSYRLTLLTEYLCHKWPRICSICLIKIRSCPHYWLITRFITRVSRRVPRVEQGLLTLPEHLSSPPDVSGLRVLLDLWFSVWWFMDRCLFFCPFAFVFPSARVSSAQYPVFGLPFFEGIIRTVSSVWPALLRGYHPHSIQCLACPSSKVSSAQYPVFGLPFCEGIIRTVSSVWPALRGYHPHSIQCLDTHMAY